MSSVHKVDFLYIGPPKAGSSWIFELLKTHPQVFVPEAKDIYFFDRFYEKGWNWYQKFFEGYEDKISGELSHDYLYSELACQRIKRDLPNVKIIVTLRDPVERAISHYRYSVMHGNVRGTLADAIRQNDSILECSRYSKYLPRYLEHFGRDKVLLLDFNKLKTSPKLFAETIFEFLGVDPSASDFDFGKRVNEAMAPRNIHLSKFVKKSALFFRQVGMANLVGKVKRSAVKQIVYKSPSQKLEISSEDLKLLQDSLNDEKSYVNYLVSSYRT
jgi:hypothetical protein